MISKYPIKNALKDNVLYKPDSGTFMRFSILPNSTQTVQLLNMNDVPDNFRTDALITIKINGKKFQSKLLNSIIISKMNVNKILTTDTQPFSITIIDDILTIESLEILPQDELVTGNLLFTKITI